MKVNRLHSLKGHRDAIYTLQHSSEESKFFSAGGDGMVVLWDQRSSEEGQLIAKLPNSIYGLHFHQQSGLLIAGQNFQGIHVLDWKNKKEVASLQLTSAAIFDIQSSENNLIVATGEGAVHIVDLKTMSTLSTRINSEKSARTIAVNKITGDIAVGYSDNYIRVFDQKINLKKEWSAHTNSVFTLRYTPDNQFLISGSRDARLKAWDVNGDYGQAAEVVAHLFAINHIEFSPDGKHFVTCSMDKSIKVWLSGELKLLKVIDKARHAGHGTSVNKLLWTGYRNQLASSSDDRTISLWEIIF
jgi:WD40 repeat protein